MTEIWALVGTVQQWTFEWVVGPFLFAIGEAIYLEEAFNALEGVIVGLFALIVIYLVVRPLEIWRPVERWADQRAVRTDVIYTMINHLGVVPLALFILLDPLERQFHALLDDFGMVPWTLDQTFPALQAWPVATMVIYVFVFDFFEYWRHRFQHRLTWWWSLHALHHSQTQMTLWTDTRNHLLDDVIRHVWLVTVALLVGAPPASYLLVVVLIMAVESLSHANVRMSFGSIGDRLVVSPLFHRVHHAVEQSGARWGCNFAVLFPVWDILFRTARYDRGYLPTGILPDGEPDYGDGFWRQQVVGVVRLAKALVGRAPPSPTAGAVRDAR